MPSRRRLLNTTMALGVLVGAGLLARSAIGPGHDVTIPARPQAVQIDVAVDGPAPEPLPASGRSPCQYPEPGVLDSPAPAPPGWSENDLQRARTYWDSLQSAALVVLHRGEPVATWGEPSRKFLVQSVRKSLLNALIGVAVRMDSIDLAGTLGELGIDDSPRLTTAERKATVEDLLLARSGIYHSALYDPTDDRPERGSHPPGTHWFYNNWDFNALGTIFERETGRTIHGAFDEWIAGPLGMEDYGPSDVTYITRGTLSERVMGNESDHAAYLFSMSTRDLARFGLLYLCGGRWEGQQVLPTRWIAATMSGKPTGEGYDYGYLWRIDPAEKKVLFDDADVPGEIWVASGSRGHLIVVAPALELVVAHQVATEGAGVWAQTRRLVFGSSRVRWAEFEKLLRLIVRSHPASVDGAAP